MNLLMVVAGGLFLYEGVSRGMNVYPAMKEKRVQMTVVKVENRNNRRIFPDYEAVGFIADNRARVSVPIFGNQFRTLHAGDSLAVYSLSGGRWLTQSKLDESRPMFNLFGFHFSWHLPAGILLLLGWFKLVPYLRRREELKKASRAAALEIEGSMRGERGSTP